MANVLDQLKRDPAFRALSPQDQIIVSQRVLAKELAKDPQFLALPLGAREIVLNASAVKGVTFEDPQLEAEMTDTGSGIVRGKRGDTQYSEKVRFWDSVMQGSGALGLAEKVIQGPNAQRYAANRQRVLDYFKAVDTVANTSSDAQDIGSVLGFLGDIAIVSAVTSPLTSLARAGISVAARGTTSAVLGEAKAAGTAAKAAAKAAGATGKAARAAGFEAESKILPPVIRSKLDFYGPIAAESLIEAVPYFVTSEQQKLQTGQPTSLSIGAADVAKTLGMNAAADFVVGSLATHALSLAVKTGSKIFRKNEIYDELKLSDEQFKDALKRLGAGESEPEALSRLVPIDRDKNLMRLLYQEMKDRPEELLENPKNRAAWFGVHGGSIWGQVNEALPEGGVKTWYRAWNFDKNGNAQMRRFENFTDLEDHLAIRFYNAVQGAPDEEAKGILLGSQGAYMLRRGELLTDQMARIDSPEMIKNDPVLATFAGKMRTPKTRIIVTKAEADQLAQGTTVVQTQIPLGGRIIENIKNQDLGILRGIGVRTVRQVDDPNAMYFGVAPVSDDVYQVATVRAQNMVQRGAMPNVEEARASILLNEGFDHHMNPDGSVEFFSTRAMKLIGTPEDVIKSVRRATDAGPISTKVIIEEKAVLTKDAKAALKSPDTAIDSMTFLLRSNASTEDYTIAVKSFLEGRGISGDISIRKVPSGKTGLTEVDGKVILQVPASPPTTFADEKQVVSDILGSLQRYANRTSTRKNLRGAAYWTSKVQRAPNRFVLQGVSDPTVFAAQVAAKLGGRVAPQGDKILVALNSGNRVFDTIQDAASYLARRSLDHNTLVNDLARQGVRLTKTPQGGFVARTSREGKVLAQGSLDTVLDQIEYVPTSLDISYGPRVVSINENGIEMEWTGQTVVKSQKEAMKLLSQFEDHAVVNRSMNIVAKQEGTIDFTPNGVYRVYSTGWGQAMDFDSLAAARKWLDTDMPSLEEITEMAEKKFLDFYIDRGKYVIQASDKTYKVSSLDEVRAVFRDYPDISGSVPNVLDEIDSSIESSIADIVRLWQGRKKLAALNRHNAPPEVFDPAANPLKTNYMIARASISEMNGWVEDVANKLNLPTLRKMYLQMEEGNRRARAEDHRAARMMEWAFKDSKGKLLKRDSRQRIYYYLAATSEEDREALQAIYRERYGEELASLTTDEELAASRFKQILDTLGDKFHIDSVKLLTHYMPRLRETYIGAPNRAELQMAQELTQKAWGEVVPKEMKFFAENERTEEIARFWLKDDALEVGLLYSAQGHKKLYMNEAWKEMYRYAQTAKLPDAIKRRLDVYRMQLMGSHHTDMEKVIEGFGEGLFRSIARGPLGKLTKMNESEMAEKGKSLLNAATGLVYFSSMGWKPFLAIRNVISGPMVGVAGRFGLDWTLRAWDDILNKGDDYIRYLRSIGVVSEKPPIVNQVFNRQTKFGKVMEKSMEWFKNSDDLTRAIAYRTAEMRFESALSAQQRGLIKTRKQFEDLSGLDVMEPEIRDSVWAKLTAPGAAEELIRQAKYDYASRVTIETQFQYQAANAPLMFQGSVGKLFGQFGTYSAGYRANLARMFKYASVPKRAEMALRFLAVTSACWATFEAMKIRTNDFIPVVPSAFSGGPAFDVGVLLMQATDVQGYEGAQAREKLKYQLPRLLPGAQQVSYIQKMMEYSEKGDSYGAFLSLLNIPYKD